LAIFMSVNTKVKSPRLAINKWQALINIGWRDSIYHPNRVIAQSITIFIRLSVLLLLYTYAYHYYGQSVSGISLIVAIWSLAIYFILLSFNARHIFSPVNQDVISGKIENLLNKPVGYLFYRVSLHLGQNFLSGIVTVIVAITTLAFLMGWPTSVMSPLWAAQTVLLSLFGLTLSYIIYLIIGLAAFWLTNAQPLFWIVDKSIMILGGAYLPVALFPKAIQTIAEFSPFGATMFTTYIFYPTFSDVAPRLLLVQLLWILVGAILLKVIYKAGERRLTINGG
jgi:ABC-2 type transport system permease protein